jgi:prepilin-type N-terminal cleavage/methylation domain-containing protein
MKSILPPSTHKGFTLLEMIIVIFLVGLVSGLIFASFNALSNRETLDKEVDNIKSIIHKTRLESLNAKNSAAHGIKVASTTLTTTETGTSTVMVYSFPTGVTLQINGLKTVSGGAATSSIEFAQISGMTNATGTLTYVFKSGSTNMATRTITINALGTVE